MTYREKLEEGQFGEVDTEDDCVRDVFLLSDYPSWCGENADCEKCWDSEIE